MQFSASRLLGELFVPVLKIVDVFRFPLHFVQNRSSTARTLEVNAVEFTIQPVLWSDNQNPARRVRRFLFSAVRKRAVHNRVSADCTPEIVRAFSGIDRPCQISLPRSARPERVCVRGRVRVRNVVSAREF